MMRWMLKHSRPLRWLVPMLVALSVVGMFSGSNEPLMSILESTAAEEVAFKLHTGNSILFNLSVGFLTGVFVWILVGWIPEQRRRFVLKNNLARHYQNFKEEVIQILLWASVGGHDSDLPKRLTNYQEFQDFFKAANDRNWYAALNGLQGSPNYLNDILVELELLANEVSYLLNNMDIADDEVHSFFKRLSEHIYRLKSSTVFTHDQVKYLGNFLWEILARWSMIDGQRKNDIVQDMIDRI